jgi:type IV secretory pathway VirB2 component (pilin)
MMKVCRGALRTGARFGFAALSIVAPIVLYAQSPFDTGAENLITDFQTFAAPVAVVVVIALGIAVLVGSLSWAWLVGAIGGIALIFGAQDVVDWIRNLFGF